MAIASVQLDRNSSAKHLERNCNEQRLVTCHRLPQSMRRDADDVVLAYAKARGRVLFTYDRTIVIEFWTAIVDGFPGVVILSQDDHGPFIKLMTYEAAIKLLAKFKSDFPQWHSISWENSVVEIKPSFIDVNHVESGGVLRTNGGLLTWANAGWQAELQRLLTANASRTNS